MSHRPRQTSHVPPAQSARWPVRKLALMLYPFVVPAVAINLFMLALMGRAIGLPSLSPWSALAASLPLGIPASWAAGRWLRHLLDEAEN